MQCPWKKRLKGRSGIRFDNSKGGMRLALRCTHVHFPSRGGILRQCSSLPSFPWACDCNLNYQEAFLPLRKESIGSGVPGGKWRCGERKGKSAVKLNQNCLGGGRVCARHDVLPHTIPRKRSLHKRPSLQYPTVVPSTGMPTGDSNSKPQFFQGTARTTVLHLTEASLWAQPRG